VISGARACCEPWTPTPARPFKPPSRRPNHPAQEDPCEIKAVWFVPGIHGMMLKTRCLPEQ
jgi:hypothetical protein